MVIILNLWRKMMVNPVSRFVSTYLDPLKKGVKQEQIKDNALQNSFFDKIDKDNNEELNEAEAKVLADAKELDPNDQQQKEIMEIASRVAQIRPEDTETILALQNNGTNEIVVVSKPTADGTVFIKTLVEGDREHPLVLKEERAIKNNAETITKYNDDGSKSVTQGAVTTNYDPQNRVTSKVTDKGGGVSEKVEYEYEGESNVPKKQVNTAPDGTRTEITENIVNPNEEPQAAPSSEPPAGPSAAPSSEPPAGPSAAPSSAPPTGADRNGKVFAKEGESFLRTAQRIFGDPNLTKDDPRYKALAEANPRDARRNWFRLGAEIKIPDSIKEQLADEAFGVDNAAEEQQYVNKAVDRANIENYNDDNTEVKTLDRSTSWWMLAKKNLQETGVANPTYAQIYERIGELVKMNPGKEPIAGTELKMPKATDEPPTGPSAAPSEEPPTGPSAAPSSEPSQNPSVPPET